MKAWINPPSLLGARAPDSSISVTPALNICVTALPRSAGNPSIFNKDRRGPRSPPLGTTYGLEIA